MKINISIIYLAIIIIIIIIITYFIYTRINEPTKTVSITNGKDYNIVTLRIPNSIEPNIFGPKLWEARHALAELTPCYYCRLDAVSHEQFFHDYVNKKTNKPLLYPDNFNNWIEKIKNI